jgi:hypothetical protein
MSTYTADHEPIAESTLDALASELGAMQVIGQALSSIRDRETRQRVLAWAHERFTMAPAPEPLPIRSTAVRAADEDPTLSVDCLFEFFEPRTATALLAPEPADAQWQSAPFAAAADVSADRGDGPLHKVIRGIASGVELLAGKWLTA